MLSPVFCVARYAAAGSRGKGGSAEIHRFLQQLTSRQDFNELKTNLLRGAAPSLIARAEIRQRSVGPWVRTPNKGQWRILTE